MAFSSRRFSVAGWAGVALLFALAAWLFSLGMHRVRSVYAPTASGAAAVGEALPDAKLTRLDGRPTSLRAYIGHPLWINVFATWCPPCKAELPNVERRYAAQKAGGLVVLGVDEQESPSAVSAFVKRFGITYPIAIDEGPAAISLRADTIPISVFVDAGGTVRWIQLGQMSPVAMDSALAKIMGQP